MTPAPTQSDRSVYRMDIIGIDHPDAILIQHAPDLLAMLRDAESEARNQLVRLKLCGLTDGPAAELWKEKQEQWAAVIAKATGQPYFDPAEDDDTDESFPDRDPDPNCTLAERIAYENDDRNLQR